MKSLGYITPVLIALIVSVPATMAQYGGGGGTGGGGSTGGGSTGGSGGGATGGGGATAGYAFNSNYHVSFNRPEAWGLKYFASSTLLSGLNPDPPSPEGRRFGSVTV